MEINLNNELINKIKEEYKNNDILCRTKKINEAYTFIKEYFTNFKEKIKEEIENSKVIKEDLNILIKQNSIKFCFKGKCITFKLNCNENTIEIIRKYGNGDYCNTINVSKYYQILDRNTKSVEEFDKVEYINDYINELLDEYMLK